MSKIGKKPIIVPVEVKVEIGQGKIIIFGPKGELEVKVPRRIKIEKRDNQLFVLRLSEEKKVKALHGTIRQLVANAIAGVIKAWEKSLEVVGTGYRAVFEQEELVLSVGFSHQVRIKPPKGIKIEVEGQNKIHVSGIDKALVGQVAAEIRAIRPPDAYKGKGIRYMGEVVKFKPGKVAQTGAAGAIGK